MGDKAAFFHAPGFSREQWPALAVAVALRKLASAADVTEGWNHHTTGSMFSTVSSRVPVAGRPSSGPSGLWTQARMRRDWSRRIRVKNESER